MGGATKRDAKRVSRGQNAELRGAALPTSAFCPLPSALRSGAGLELYRSAPENISLPPSGGVCYRAPFSKPVRRRIIHNSNIPGGSSGEENHGRVHLDRRTETDSQAPVEDEDHRPGEGPRRHPRMGL